MNDKRSLERRQMRVKNIFLAASLLVPGFLSGAAVMTEDVKIQGQYLNLVISPQTWGSAKEFVFPALGVNYAGEGGLVQEGFGVGNMYVPNRRLNEKLEKIDSASHPTLQYSYDCDGPNIKGLRVTRVMEASPDEASLLVHWSVENKGTEAQWVAPWVRNPVSPGGSLDPSDRVDIPTFAGVRHVNMTAYYPASRNWAAVTDTAACVSVCGVFNADQTHSFLAVWDPDTKRCGFQAAYIPTMLKPGDVWKTAYRLNLARGLKHVDFATDELSAQIDYQSGKLVLLLSSVKKIDGLQIHSSVIAGNGQIWKMPAKAFNIDPNIVVRSTYNWTAPSDGAYEFMAGITSGKTEQYKLGKDTASPHGGIDTQFFVGAPKMNWMDPWTDAPLALNHGARTLKRSLATAGETAIWIENSLEKIFREDNVVSDGRIDNTARISLARNERESFQVIMRPPKGKDLTKVTCKVESLVNDETGASIKSSDIRAYVVGYCPVRVPSYFEGPTGDWPDPLLPMASFTTPGGCCTPIWITVYARPDLPAGKYVGNVVLSYPQSDPITLRVEAVVYGFALPTTPSLKTDFGFRADMAAESSKAKGCKLSSDALTARYAEDALEHRVTLREPFQFPAPSTDYSAQLTKCAPKAKDGLARGATTFAVPSGLSGSMDQLEKADAFVVGNNLRNRAFCPLADNPEPSTHEALAQKLQVWHATAPDIPSLVASFGMQPFLPEGPVIWSVHTQMLDTPNNKPILDRISSGGEVWWYVNRFPARPYANFLLDFAGMEHRILFWQTWALGVRGMQYWCVNYCEKWRDPYAGLTDVTPVNGDGLLVYPGADGPVDSIRWEIIRDGIEDYDYLRILADRVKKLEASGGNAALVARAKQALNLKEIVPDLTSFPRDSKPLLNKRDEIARMIVEIGG
jgi:hypothetical protein